RSPPDRLSTRWLPPLRRRATVRAGGARATGDARRARSPRARGRHRRRPGAPRPLLPADPGAVDRRRRDRAGDQPGRRAAFPRSDAAGTRLMELTLGTALIAGFVSFLSPCVLPVVPAYLGQLGVIVATSVSPAVVAVGRGGLAPAGGAPLAVSTAL